MMTFDWRADIADSAKDGDATGSGGSRFEISPVDGVVESVPERRDWTIVFRGVSPVGALRTLDGKPRFSKEPFVAYGMPDAVNGVLEEILLRS